MKYGQVARPNASFSGQRVGSRLSSVAQTRGLVDNAICRHREDVRRGDLAMMNRYHPFSGGRYRASNQVLISGLNGCCLISIALTNSNNFLMHAVRATFFSFPFLRRR